MRFAASNIALPAYDHTALFPALAAMGLSGLEVAPSRIWTDTLGVTPAQIGAYRRAVEAAGLQVVGLHSLFFDQPGLGMFQGAEIRARTLDFLVHLSALCRDLGGRTLIYGSAPARRRGALSLEAANAWAVDFLGELTSRIEAHGTCYCFEPLGPDETDYINSVHDALYLVRTVNSPALRTQIDAKALLANHEMTPSVFEAARDTLVHVHVNDPGLVVLGATGQIDHAAMAAHLRAIGYQGFVSIEQRMLSEADPLADLAASAAVLAACYGDAP